MGVPASLAEGTLEIRKARGEVVGACHWAGEVDDPIVDAVTGYSEHAIQHYLVSMQLAGEGKEVESVLPDAPEMPVTLNGGMVMRAWCAAARALPAPSGRR